MRLENKSQRLAKDTIIFAIGSLGTKFIQFFMVPLYTNFMTQSQYGISNLIFTLSQLMLPLLSLTIYDAVLRFGMSKNEKREDVLKTALVIFLIDIVLAFTFVPLIKLYEPLSSWSIFLVIYLLLGILYSTVMNYLKVKNKNLIYAMISIVQTFVVAGLNILFIAFYKKGIDGYMLSSIIAIALACLLAIILGEITSDFKKGNVDVVLLKRMLKYSTPLIFNAISWWLISSSDKIMIELMCGSALLGLYSVAAKIPALINVFINIFQQSWGLSTIREMETSSDRSFYSQIYEIYSTLIFGTSMMVIFLHKPLMSIYIGKSFQDAIYYIPFLIFSATFSALSSFWGSIYTAMKDSKGIMQTTIYAATVNVAINYLAIRKLGVMGAVLGTVVAYVLISNHRMIHLRRAIGIKINIIKYSVNATMLFIVSLLSTIGRETIYLSLICIVIFGVANQSAFIRKDKV